MLTQSSVSAAFPLADKLAARGFSLRALDQTPLSELIGASLSQANVVAATPANAPVETVSDMDFAQQLIEGSTFASPQGGVLHDEIMESAVKVIGEAVTAGLHLAKNVVNPLIKQVMADTQAHMDGSESAALTPLNIVPLFYKPIWDSVNLIDFVGRFAQTPYQSIGLRQLQIETPDLKAAAMTGAGHFDSEIAEFIDSMDPARVDFAWSAVFGPNPLPDIQEVLKVNPTNCDIAILVYLFANRLQEDVPAGVNMDLADWRLYTAEIRAQAGRTICRVMEKRVQDRARKLLVLEAPRGDAPRGDVLVNGDVYNTWLKDGGAPEIIFGALYSTKETDAQGLLDRADYFKGLWNHANSMITAAAANKRFSAMVAGLRNAMTKAINELPEDQLPVARADLHARLAERLTHAKQKDLENMWHLCRKAVCRVIFPHTDAEKILLAIDVAGQQHPDMDVREIALLGTMDYIATWLCKLVMVQEVPDSPGV